MAYLIDLETHTDIRGNLTVIENVFPFTIQRVFYIYGVDKSERGGHRHHKTIQAAVCIQGDCKILTMMGGKKRFFILINLPNVYCLNLMTGIKCTIFLIMQY